MEQPPRNRAVTRLVNKMAERAQEICWLFMEKVLLAVKFNNHIQPKMPGNAKKISFYRLVMKKKAKI